MRIWIGVWIGIGIGIGISLGFDKFVCYVIQKKINIDIVKCIVIVFASLYIIIQTEFDCLKWKYRSVYALALELALALAILLTMRFKIKLILMLLYIPLLDLQFIHYNQKDLTIQRGTMGQHVHRHRNRPRQFSWQCDSKEKQIHIDNCIVIAFASLYIIILIRFDPSAWEYGSACTSASESASAIFLAMRFKRKSNPH